jgi:hypothetical protein
LSMWLLLAVLAVAVVKEAQQALAVAARGAI